MKLLVLIFSLLGIAGSAFLGMKWLSDLEAQRNDPETKLMLELAKTIATLDDVQKEKYDQTMAKLKRLEVTAYILIGCAVLALISLFALGRNGFILGVVLIACSAAPVAYSSDPKLFIFTGFLALAGLIALLGLRPLAPKSSHRPID